MKAKGQMKAKTGADESEGGDESEEEEGAEEDEEEVEEIQIRETPYYTSNRINGAIYDVDEDGEPGTWCGRFVNGVPHFN